MLGRVVGVEEQRIDGLVAFKVDDAQRLAPAHDMHPILAGGDDLAVLRGFGVERADSDHEWAPAQQPSWNIRLFSKPRIFSGADRRAGSSAAAGGPSQIS